jgi:hypothetical protein
MDPVKALDEIKQIVSDLVIDDFVRELLADLRKRDDENKPWAESTIDWLVNEMWGEPDPVESES